MNSTMLDCLIKQVVSKLHEPVVDSESLNQWKTELFTLINSISEFKLSFRSKDTEKSLSLDPDDWRAARYLTHKMLDSSLDYIQYIRNRPIRQWASSDIRTLLEDEPFPEQGQTLASVCDDILEYVIPYARGNAHPRFWAWVVGEGTLSGIIGETIAASLNMNVCDTDHSGAFIEKAVIKWMCQLFNFPKETTRGLLVTGTSMATIISMAVARQRILPNVRQDGMMSGYQLIVYASTETHTCVVKALELLGLGSKALHLISVDESFRINTLELRTAIQNDRSNGLIPFCIVGNAGTVNVGAFDNLSELSSIARAENLWFHIDGALGSFVVLDHERRHLVNGIDQADSLAFDFHKWFHCPHDVGCILIRNGDLLRSTFTLHQSYLNRTIRAFPDDDIWFCDLGPELSRSFRALKVWCTLKEHGTVRLGQKIAENCEQIQYLVSLLDKHSRIIYIFRPILLNIVNFRFEPEEFGKNDQARIDMFNKELVLDIQLSGIAFLSTTRIHDRLYIRMCIVSHRTTVKDLDLFMETLFNFYQEKIKNLSFNRK
ncbi:unnamed protein product [Adineta ricciae]|uniref:Uncharacterized protein n=1 Tax=Adineta ricciae TaxID=249248 RepID=A0A815M2J5_ADIRI